MMRILCLLMLVLSAQLAAAQPLPALIPYRTKAGWGYSDSTRRLIIPAIYSSAELFRNGMARTSIDKGRERFYCLIDEKGRYIIPPEYHWSGESRSGDMNVHDDKGNWGLVNDSGRVIIPVRYRRSDGKRSAPYFQDFLLSERNRLVIAADSNGAVLLDEKGRSFYPFSFYDDYKPLRQSESDTVRGWTVRKGSLYGVIGPDAALLFPVKYEAIYPSYLNPSLAVAKLNGRMGLVDSAGHILVPFRYDTVEMLRGSGVPFSRNGKWGWYTVKTGTETPAVFAEPPFSRRNYVTGRKWVEADNRYVPLLLLSSGRQLIEGGPYETFHLYQDSVVAVHLNHDSSDFEYSRLDEKTWKPLHWNPEHHDAIQASPVNRIDPVVEIIDGPRRFYIVDSVTISRFAQNGQEWIVAGYVRSGASPGYGNTELYAVSSADGRLHGLVDRKRRFVLPPQDRYRITGGDLLHNWLSVTYTEHGDTFYQVTDSQLRPLEPPIRRSFSRYFRWKGKAWYFGEWKAGQPWYPQRQARDCFRCNCNTLLDRKGNVAKGFEQVCRPRFFPAPVAGLQWPQNDLIVVEDSLYRTGFLNLKGKVKYPGLSFRYRDIHFFSPDLVMAARADQRWYIGVLLNSAGRELLPTDIAYQFIASGNRLFLIEFSPRISKSGRRSFYMDYRGTIYADADIFE